MSIKIAKDLLVINTYLASEQLRVSSEFHGREEKRGKSEKLKDGVEKGEQWGRERRQEVKEEEKEVK